MKISDVCRELSTPFARVASATITDNFQCPQSVVTLVLPLVINLYLIQPDSINQNVSRRLYCYFVCYQETKYALPLASTMCVCMYVMQQECRINFSPWVDVRDNTQW